MIDLAKRRAALMAEVAEFKKACIELWFVPDLAASYTNRDFFCYSIIEDDQVFFMIEQARQLWTFWNKAKAQAVPEGYVLFPKVATKAIDEILGMQCFQFIRTAQIYRQLGFGIKKRAENEQAFFLFKFLHLALVHGDKYLDVFNAETRKLIEASESGAEG
ncbi:hypothetical protein VXR58_12560 [Acinetobacter pittii]|uniref:hypothetical protein n=1 Tax=Acinetobacter pittii TaxID=48296 RepID=UPI003A8BE74D